MVVSPEAVPLPPGAGWLAAGSGFSAYPALRLHVAAAVSGFDADVVPGAAAIGALALPRFAAGEGVPARDAAPLYVRHRVAVTVAERAAGAVL
jgi:tRNA threonylcarbamoyladenosine biosynthesis protein TsaB